MRKRISLTASLLLLATSFCHARAWTLAEADAIIIILLFIVTALVVLGGFSLHYNRIVSRRNEQLLRILNALDDYRAIVGDELLSLDEQEDMLTSRQPKPKAAKAVHTDGSQAFYVKMDARVNKEKPFTDPDFDQQALAEFMEVDLETFCRLVPRYKDPERTLDYINSLRAEYAAKLLMDHSEYSTDDLAVRCGFKDSAAFIGAFKFALGITPTDYLHGMSQMFKKKAISLALAALVFCGTSVLASCGNGTPPDITSLTEWQAGKIVSAEAVAAFGGIDNCFAAEPIPDGVWQRMQGKTYKENPYIGRDDLRHVRALHWDYDNQMHIGEMVCNKEIADCVARILRQLFDAKYPIQRMLLPDVYDADDETQMRDNNSSCFCYRTIAGSAKLSKHARVAIDINTLYNPYYRDLEDGTRYIQPATAEAYCDRSWDFPYKIDHDDLCFKLFTEAGFDWGGDWTTRKDYQHFEIIE